ncbi:MAG: NdvB protein, partial [Pseudomonadota bacterium]
MLLQLNCQGYAIGQHMQPEPGKYSHGPMLEQRTFMQPEPAYYAHHPGRFVYVKDATDGALFSAPHAPVGSPAEVFEFSAGDSDVLWRVTRDAVDVQMQVHLPADEAVELWQIVVTNRDDETRELSIYPTFSIGYMSWMNQSAGYDADLGGIVAACVTPYQKLGDYPSIRTLKDSTVLLHDSAPDAWETSRVAFEGAGGIHAPDAVYADTLGNGDAIYESPIASLQYRMTLAPGEQRTLRFVFGPARSGDAARHWRDRYLVAGGFEAALQQHQQYLAEGNTRLATRTPDVQFSEFVNHWLGRQVLYHGQLNRMTTDPQTRNFLQDAMGMTYLAPATTRAALITALTQQQPDGGMP